jgi:hypothetical protein
MDIADARDRGADRPFWHVTANKYSHSIRVFRCGKMIGNGLAGGLSGQLSDERTVSHVIEFKFD